MADIAFSESLTHLRGYTQRCTHGEYVIVLVEHCHLAGMATATRNAAATMLECRCDWWWEQRLWRLYAQPI